MTTMQIEEEVQKLPPTELAQFTEWFERFIADQWDTRFEQDAQTGRLDHLAQKADSDFEAGHCTTL